jgi:hypothetical protein
LLFVVRAVGVERSMELRSTRVDLFCAEEEVEAARLRVALPPWSS